MIAPRRDVPGESVMTRETWRWRIVSDPSLEEHVTTLMVSQDPALASSSISPGAHAPIGGLKQVTGRLPPFRRLFDILEPPGRRGRYQLLERDNGIRWERQFQLRHASLPRKAAACAWGIDTAAWPIELCGNSGHLYTPGYEPAVAQWGNRGDSTYLCPRHAGEVDAALRTTLYVVTTLAYPDGPDAVGLERVPDHLLPAYRE